VHHRLKQAGVNFRWFVVGSGPEEATLRAEIDRLGMHEDFVILPYQENIYACMKSCDVFALFSASEGCPTVVLEALLLGCAVVMTDVNGADELLEEGRTGLIVANHADAIAEGLARMVQDSELRRRFREAVTSRNAERDRAHDGARIVGLIEDRGPAAAIPKVSVLIPTYNQERFIDRAIASALSQECPGLEVIVADDASTDGTGAAAELWGFDRRFRYVRNEQNLGRVANYRRTLQELARGEWVLMLDGDDFLTDPGFLRRATGALERHADRPIVFAQAGHRVHYLDGSRRDVDILPPIDGDERVLTGGEYLRFVYETKFFTHLGALYQRQRALSDGFYTAEISSSDMDSLLRLALEGEVLVLNTIAGCWVQHGSNASSALALAEITPNVRIFRQIAALAVERGASTWAELDGPLTRYEADTLIHLFVTTIGKSARGPADLVRMVGIAAAVHPRLLLDGPLLRYWLGFLGPLTGLALERSRLGKRALRLLRRLWPHPRAEGGA
jgi:hypothetical protein